MDEPDLPKRAGFESNNARVANRDVADAYIAAGFARLTRQAAAAKLKAANIAFGFVNEVADLAVHPALRRITVESSAGPVSLAAPPVLLSDGERALGPVPDVGAQSAAIRAEFAG